MAAIRFLTTVANGVHHNLFRSESVLREVCERIVLPNLRMTDDLLEVFEGNFVEYIRRDTEGSDFDTRRRAATELVRSLTTKFPEQVGPHMPCMLCCCCCCHSQLAESLAGARCRWPDVLMNFCRSRTAEHHPVRLRNIHGCAGDLRACPASHLPAW